MHAMVVFETVWGNTEELAREIAAGIGADTVDVVDAASAPPARTDRFRGSIRLDVE